VLFRSARDVPMPFEITAPSTVAGGAKDAVELPEGKLGDRIVLVNEDPERIAPPRDVVGTGGGDDLGDVVAVLTLEGQALRPKHAAAGDADVGGAAPECADRCGRALQIPVDLDVGMEFTKLSPPDIRKAAVREVVVSPDSEGPGDLLPRRVLRQSREVELVRRIEGLRASFLDEPLAGTLQFERVLTAARLAHGLRQQARHCQQQCNGQKCTCPAGQFHSQFVHDGSSVAALSHGDEVISEFAAAPCSRRRWCTVGSRIRAIYPRWPANALPRSGQSSKKG